MDRTTEEIESILKTERPRRFTQMPEYLPNLHSMINKYMEIEEGDGQIMTAEQFSEILVKNNAIVAGGFVTHAISNTPPNLRILYTDVDIYVSCKNIESLYEDLIRISGMPLKYFNHRKPSPYCKSFLRKNGIRSVSSFEINNKRYDIMAVRNARLPVDVAQNFDLSFCQNLYDGEMIYSTHPAHAIHKVGYLQKEYLQHFYSGNQFIKARIEKYTNRGYKVFIESQLTEVIAISNLKGNVKNDDSFRSKWIFQAILQYIVTGDYSAYNNCNAPNNNYDTPKLRRFDGPDRIYNAMDGYDTDDYEKHDGDNKPVFNKLYPLAKKYATFHDPALDALTDEEKFYQLLRKFIERVSSKEYTHNIIASRDYAYYINNGFVGEFIDTITRCVDYANRFIKPINNYVLRTGVCTISRDTELVYDIHAHKIDEGISREGMEAYLRQYIPASDKNRIPCYMNTCNQFITLDTVAPIVSNEFYEEYANYKTPLLDESIEDSLVASLMNKFVLEDVPVQTDGWGEIYSKSICPFCLSIHDRDAGCIYVTHPNRRDRQDLESPFCTTHIIIPEILQKYKDAVRDIPTGDRGRITLEFCTVCGRPSVNHQHLTISDNPVIEVNNQGAIQRYAECPGGGRPEMIARLLAIRKVIKDYQGNDTIKELRRLAAIAADFAGIDQELLAEARRILEDIPAEREFQNGVTEIVTQRIAQRPPLTINSDLNLSDISGTNNNDRMNELNDNQNNQLGGLRIGRTRNHKKLKVKKTRKHLKKKTL